MLYEDADSTLLRLFECFMEAAPQLCLQLYIMASTGLNETEWYLGKYAVQHISFVMKWHLFFFFFFWYIFIQLHVKSLRVQ